MTNREKERSTNQVREMWNELANTWAGYAKDPRDYWTRRTGLIAEVIERHVREGKALDVGCGSGLLCRILAERGFDVHGADISENMVQRSMELLSEVVDDPETRVRLCPDGEIPFEGLHFRLITVIGVLQYIQERSAYVRKLASFLEPGGILVLSSSNRFSLFIILSLFSRILRLPVRPTKEWIGTMVNLARTGIWSGGFVDYKKAENIYSASALDKLAVDQGLKVIDSIGMYNLGWLDRAPLGRGRLGRRIARTLAWSYIGVYQKGA